MLCDHSFRWMDEVVMKTRRLILIALGMLPAAAGFPAGNPRVDFVSKAFRDGSFIPHVYSERDFLRRYGDGELVVDATGLMRRRYLDPTTRLEVLITSNPDVAPQFRTIDEIRGSSISAAQPTAGRTESQRGGQADQHARGRVLHVHHQHALAADLEGYRPGMARVQFKALVGLRGHEAARITVQQAVIGRLQLL